MGHWGPETTSRTNCHITHSTTFSSKIEAVFFFINRHTDGMVRITEPAPDTVLTCRMCGARGYGCQGTEGCWGETQQRLCGDESPNPEGPGAGCWPAGAAPGRCWLRPHTDSKRSGFASKALPVGTVSEDAAHSAACMCPHGQGRRLAPEGGGRCGTPPHTSHGCHPQAQAQWEGQVQLSASCILPAAGGLPGCFKQIDTAISRNCFYKVYLD